MSRKNRIALVVVVWVSVCGFALSRSGVTSGSIARELPELWYDEKPCVKCGKPGTTAFLQEIEGGQKVTWCCGQCAFLRD